MTEALPLLVRDLAIGWKGRGHEPLSIGIDLEMRPGDFAVVIGPNGSGKSTLLRTLVGLQPQLGGMVTLGGADVRRLGIEDRATLVACVFTDRSDSGYFTVFDIVAFGRYPYTDSRNSLTRVDIAAIEHSIRAVGMAGLERRRFAELSDGERQKTLIARAIAQDCPLLVLDEPTAFLDAPARVEIFHVARDLARSSGKAVILSTHDIDQALRYADILLLMDGSHRLVGGAPEDLALSGAIGRAFDGEGFRFDLETGSFKSVELGLPFAVELLGSAGPARAWAERLIERTGYGFFGGGPGEPLARVAIIESEDVPTFEVGGRIVRGYAELARVLSQLASKAVAQNAK